jgi:hypothetical protein
LPARASLERIANAIRNASVDVPVD